MASSTAAGSGVGAALPSGMIVPFAGDNIPTGWLLCDGQQVSRSSYRDLFNAIGTAWGNGDGSSTFHVPDMRGGFLRGVDDPAASSQPAAGRDPAAGSRTALNAGGNTGNNVGSYQADEVGPHAHPYKWRDWAGASHSGFVMANGTDYGTRSGFIYNNSGIETRPRNMYVNYIIKV
jgi:hypothetical protein